MLIIKVLGIYLYRFASNTFLLFDILGGILKSFRFYRIELTYYFIRDLTQIVKIL